MKLGDYNDLEEYEKIFQKLNKDIKIQEVHLNSEKFYVGIVYVFKNEKYHKLLESLRK